MMITPSQSQPTNPPSWKPTDATSQTFGEGIAANKEPPHDEAIYVIFDLPSARQNFLWYHHTAAGFPPKETFIRAICNGNYATWP